MALGAVHCESKPCGGGGFHAVEKDHPALFFGNGSAFAIEQVISIEPAGDFLFGGGIREQVAGELPDGELIEGQIAVESADDPVPPDPLPRVSVLLKTVAVGVACSIEPGECHAFTVVGAGKHLIDELFPCVGGFVTDECVHLCGSWRESSEVDGESANERSAIRFGGGLDVIFFEFSEDEAVEGIAGPCGVIDWWLWWALGSCEGPVWLPLGSGSDPVLQQLFLVAGEEATGVRRGHQCFGVGGVDAFDESSRGGISGDHGPAGESGFGEIKSQVSLSFGRILPVAVEAVFREDWADIAVEVRGSKSVCGGQTATRSGGKQQGEQGLAGQQTLADHLCGSVGWAYGGVGVWELTERGKISGAARELDRWENQAGVFCVRSWSGSPYRVRPFVLPVAEPGRSAARRS